MERIVFTNYFRTISLQSLFCLLYMGHHALLQCSSIITNNYFKHNSKNGTLDC